MFDRVLNTLLDLIKVKVSGSLILLLLSEILSPKTSNLRKALRPDGNLTKTVKQPYGECSLPGHVFKGVQWGDVNNMMISRNIDSPLSLAYPFFYIRS